MLPFVDVVLGGFNVGSRRAVERPPDVLVRLVSNLEWEVAGLVGLVVEAHPIHRACGQHIRQADVELSVPTVRLVVCRLQLDGSGAILSDTVVDAGKERASLDFVFNVEARHVLALHVAVGDDVRPFGLLIQYA